MMAKLGEDIIGTSGFAPFFEVANADAAPCPLAFLSTGMAASFTNKILALAKIQGVEIRKLKLIQDNY